jgi:hypothetical protein
MTRSSTQTSAQQIAGEIEPQALEEDAHMEQVTSEEHEAYEEALKE